MKITFKVAVVCQTIAVIVFFWVPYFVYADFNDQLAACWEFNESSGNAIDAGPHAQDLTNTNSTAYAAGMFDNAADLETSSSNYFAKTDTSTLSITGSMSISMWVKPESNGERALMSKFAGAGSRSFNFNTDSSTSITFDIYDSTNAETAVAWTVSDLGTTAFKHLVLVYTASTHTSELYINGISQGTKDSVRTDIKDTSADFRVGGSPSSMAAFDGLIDASAVWSRALTDDEVVLLYSAGAGADCAAMMAGLGDPPAEPAATSTVSIVYDATSVFSNAMLIFLASMFGMIYIWRKR